MKCFRCGEEIIERKCHNKEHNFDILGVQYVLHSCNIGQRLEAPKYELCDKCLKGLHLYLKGADLDGNSKEM